MKYPNRPQDEEKKSEIRCQRGLSPTLAPYFAKTSSFVGAKSDVSMTNSTRSPYYRIYLLTIWEELSQEGEPQAAMRFRLEDPNTGQQRGFASLEALADALKIELAKRLE